MSVVFTKHAVERMHQLDATDHDLGPLLADVERFSGDVGMLDTSAEVVRMRPAGGEKVFIVRSGNIRAVLIVDPALPERVNVATVFVAQEDNTIEATGLVGDVHTVVYAR